MTLPSNTTSCLVCGSRLVKNGKTPAGTQRWRCPECGASSVRKRDDVARRHQLVEFLTWLLGKQSQRELDGGTGRSFRDRTAWCWQIEPHLDPATTPHHEVIVDGVWIGSWCLLIAVTKNLEVLAWQWCARESTAAWTALLKRIPAPGVIVCDGGTGIASAVRAVWPETRTQRCLFHVQMNVKQHLTLNPRTTAGRRLLALSRMLSDVVDEDTAITWRLHLETWWHEHGHLTKERTLFANGRWGFTHDRLRKAWLLLQRLSRDGTLFTFVAYGNPRTTSALEGGINAQIRTVLRHHRGMSEAHMKRAAEWFMTIHETPIAEAHRFLAATETTAHPEPHRSDSDSDSDSDSEQTTPPYGTALTADEGLWTRSGWLRGR